MTRELDFFGTSIDAPATARPAPRRDVALHRARAPCVCQGVRLRTEAILVAVALSLSRGRTDGPMTGPKRTEGTDVEPGGGLGRGAPRAAPDADRSPVAEVQEAGAAPGTVPSFEDFFLVEHPRLVALVLALSGDRGHAEDLAQEALLRAYRRWEVVGRYEKPGAWTRRVALNLATSAHRRRRSERRAVERLAARPHPVADAGPGRTEFWAMVRTLPRRQAAAVALYYLADESVAEVAHDMGCAEGTAKAHLHQARQTLAARFGDPEPDPPAEEHE